MKLAIHGAILAGAIFLQMGCGGGDGGGIATCGGSFTACGGDLTGKWSIDSVCTEGDLQDMIMDTGDLPAECSGMFQSVSIDISGTLTYANGTETSDVTTAMSAKFNYSKACIEALAGTSIPMTQAMCDSASSSSDTPMTCKLSNGGCACTMSQTDHTQESASYTTSGGVLTYADGDPMEFCVSGSNLTFRSASEGVGMRITSHRM